MRSECNSADYEERTWRQQHDRGMTGDDELRRRFYRQYPPEERTILQDLIAELRRRAVQAMPKSWSELHICYIVDAALDRAEARLREVTDE